MNIPELRSPYDTVKGVVYFARMLSKIRLHAAGRLPEEFQPNLGIGFDARCCSFLGIEYLALVEETKSGASDEQLLEWAFRQGGAKTEEQIEVWNGFMTKRGWKDDGAPMLEKRKREGGMEHRDDIQVMFAYIDADEGRPVRN